MLPNVTRCCTVCRTPGHNIRSCNDPDIENSWKELLIIVEIQNGATTISQPIMQIAKNYLLFNITRPILYALGYKMVKTTTRNSVETIAVLLCNEIQQVANRYANSSLIERRIFARWIEPELNDDIMEIEPENIIDVLEMEIEDPNSITEINENIFQQHEIPIHVEDPKYHQMIEPFMLCLESEFELSQTIECPLCLDEKKQIDIDTTNCGHTFCHECICKHIDSKIGISSCPLCRTHIYSLEVKDIENYNDIERRYSALYEFLK